METKNRTKEVKHRLIVPIQTRGGIGKSTEAVARCHWMSKRDIQWSGFDLDSHNRTFSNAYADNSGQTVTLSKVQGPSWLTLASTGPGTADLLGTPGEAGTFTIILRAAADRGLETIQTFQLVIPNRPPTFRSTPVLDGKQRTLYRYNFTAIDPDAGDRLAFRSPDLPG